jgi:hypothetical protein
MDRVLHTGARQHGELLAQHEIFGHHLGTTADGGADERHDEQQPVQYRPRMMPRRCSR